MRSPRVAVNSKMIVKPLKPDQFGRLKKIFEEEFDSDLPLPENSEILVAYEDGKMQGFILVETVQVIGQIWVTPEKRNNSSGIVQNMLKYIRAKIAPKSVVAAVASEKRFENLYKAFGMQPIEGKFFRKNIQ